MSEELLQRDLIRNPEKIGKWDFYNIGATTIKSLKENSIIRNVDYGAEERKKVDGLIVQKEMLLLLLNIKSHQNFEQKHKKIKLLNKN